MSITRSLVDPIQLTDRLPFSMGIGYAAANRQQRRHFRGPVKIKKKNPPSYVCPRRLAVALAPPPAINTGRALSDALLPRQTLPPLPFEQPELHCRGNFAAFFCFFLLLVPLVVRRL